MNTVLDYAGRGRPPRHNTGTGPLPGRPVVAIVYLIALISCSCLFGEGTDSDVTADFLMGNWHIWSIRMVDGLTLQPGENGFAGTPEKDWFLAGDARFTEDHASITYSIVVTTPDAPPDSTVYEFGGSFTVDRNSIWITQDDSGAVIQLTVRKNDAGILVGERRVDNFGITDLEGNESIWAR